MVWKQIVGPAKFVLAACVSSGQWHPLAPSVGIVPLSSSVVPFMYMASLVYTGLSSMPVVIQSGWFSSKTRQMPWFECRSVSQTAHDSHKKPFYACVNSGRKCVHGYRMTYAEGFKMIYNRLL